MVGAGIVTTQAMVAGLAAWPAARVGAGRLVVQVIVLGLTVAPMPTVGAGMLVVQAIDAGLVAAEPLGRQAMRTIAVRSAPALSVWRCAKP